MHPQEPSLRHTEALRVLSPEKRAESLNQFEPLGFIDQEPAIVLETQTNASLAVSHHGKPSASGEVGSQRSDHQVIPFAKRSSGNRMIAKRYSQRFDHKVIIMIAKIFSIVQSSATCPHPRTPLRPSRESTASERLPRLRVIIIIFKGILHQKNFYRLNIILWIVMGCGIARFGRRGLKTTET